ncbi:DUF2306 domain-containing protein [Pendulispora brunnea]|uniref:DUF2306 domain-containing protein n=1 Tax=Pendulispora brunnea TaxID=2905690 RepID=A0ABZ2K6B9_9BACT
MWVLSRVRAAAPRVFVLSLMALGAAFITASSLAYFKFDELPPFVIEKLPLRFEALWLLSLRVHVVAALISFPLCIVLMTRALQRRAVLHRWIGRSAGALILFALVPSGAVLSFEAKGGPLVSAGFLLSGALIAWFMVKGVFAARRREFGAHRRAMLHVFAQMSVAVTSRALLFGLDVAGMSPDVAYVVALWCPVLGSAAMAELLSGSLKRMVQNHGLKMAMSLRARFVARPIVRFGR